MSLNIIFFLAAAMPLLLLCTNANPLMRTPGTNVCPESTKWISPEISLSPFIVSSDSSYDEDAENPLVVVPLSIRLFKKLQMRILPSREVCVLGEKLKNISLPDDGEDSVFEIMTGIAVWFSPCISIPANNQRMQCIKQSMETIQALDIKQFKTFYALVVRAVQHT